MEASLFAGTATKYFPGCRRFLVAYWKYDLGKLTISTMKYQRRRDLLSVFLRGAMFKQLPSSLVAGTDPWRLAITPPPPGSFPPTFGLVATAVRDEMTLRLS